MDLELPFGLTRFLLRYEYLALFCLFIISEVGTPIPLPTNLMLIYCSFITVQGGGSVVLILICSFAGMMIGSVMLYSLCFWGGPKLLAKIGKYIKLTPERVAKVETWFNRWGKWAVFMGRLLPGVRIHQTAVAAGTFKVQPRTFILSAAVAGVLWIAFYIWVGYLVNQGYGGFGDYFKGHYHVFIPVLAIIVLAAGTGIFLYFRRKKRARLVTETPEISQQ